MRGKQHLNGCAYLMLGLDSELRREGLAGNFCQIMLELARPVCPVALQSRLENLVAHYPLIDSRPGGVMLPEWKLPRRVVARGPLVRFHPFVQGGTIRRGAVPVLALPQRLFNEP